MKIPFRLYPRLYPQSYPQSYRFDLAWLCSLFLLCYLMLLGAHGLIDPDEGRYSSVSVAMWQSGHWIVPHVNGAVFLDKPILFYWLQAIALFLFGLSDWSLRLFPALFSVMAGLSLYVTGRFVWNRRVGILASLIWISSPLVFGVSHFANMDILVASNVTLSIDALLCALYALEVKKNLRRCQQWMGVAYSFSALAFLTKGLIGLVFPGGVLVFWLLAYRAWYRLRHLMCIRGVLWILLLILPWMVMIQLKEPWFFHYFFIYQQFDRFLESNFNQQQPVLFYVGLVLVGSIPWVYWMVQMCFSMVRRVWREKKLLCFQDPWVAFLGIWFWMILIFFSIPKSKLPGYIVPVFAPLSLLLGIYLDGVVAAKMSRKNFRTMIASCFGGMILLEWVGLWMMPHFPVNTLNPLMVKTQSCAPKTGRVVSFEMYYQALPVIYGHPVIVVANWQDPKSIMANDDWRRMLYQGTRWGQDQAGQKWLWSPEQLQTAWSGGVWRVFMPISLVSHFEKTYAGSVLCGEYNGIALVRSPEKLKN